MLSVFAENCGGKTALTVTWLLYGRTTQRLARALGTVDRQDRLERKTLSLIS